MTEEIRIPDIGDADAVEVVEILAAAGDVVGDNDPIVVIESDKASMEVPAGLSGVIKRITVAVGDQVTTGQVIAELEAVKGEPRGADSGAVAEEPAQDAAVEVTEDVADEAPADAADEASAEGADEASADAADEPAADTADPQQAAAPASGDGESGGHTRTLEVRVPDIGEAQNVAVIEVAVKAGDKVAEDDLLVVVESDKASMEIPSTHSGTVVAVHVGEGTEVHEGTLLVTLETEAGAGSKAENKSAGTERAAEDVARPTAGERPKPTNGARSPASSVYAGPAVRRLARELGVELSAVEGSGTRGRIVKDDVKNYVKGRITGAGTVAPGMAALPRVDFSKFGETEEQPLSRIRARGAVNLHRSWINVPHVTQHDDVDVTDLEEFRGTLKKEGEQRGVKVTPLAFIIQACCHALKEFPTFNASLDPAVKTIILKRYYHLGFAVDTPDGLVVPVIRDADRKGIWALSEEVAELAEKARNKKLSVTDMQGGSFSLSSLGAIGGTGFTPIINAPEVAILGVSRLTVRPQWIGETFVPRKMLPLSLSYDHRAINGAEAGRFVARLAELLGDIRRLAL